MTGHVRPVAAPTVAPRHDHAWVLSSTFVETGSIGTKCRVLNCGATKAFVARSFRIFTNSDPGTPDTRTAVLYDPKARVLP